MFNAVLLAVVFSALAAGCLVTAFALMWRDSEMREARFMYGGPSLFTPLSGPPLPEKGPYPYEHPTRNQAPGLLNEPFMGDLNIVKE